MKKFFCIVGSSGSEVKPVRYEFESLKDATSMFTANVEKGKPCSVIISEEKCVASFSPLL